jgi:Ca2+-transporting ATPase
MAMVVFSLLNIAIGLSNRSETGTVFTRELLSDRRQLMLYGISFLAAYLATELGFLQRMLGTTSLTLQQWLIGFAMALILVLIDEVIKLFIRRKPRQPQPQPATPMVQQGEASAA